MQGSNNWIIRSLRDACQSGQLTSQLSFLAEVIGILAASPMCSWSIGNGHSAPFNAVFALLVSSVAATVVYVYSFSVHLIESWGEFAPPPSGKHSRTRRVLSFAWQMFTVSLNDMASLLEEAEWHPSSLLSRRMRCRSAADTDEFADLLERGEASCQKAK
jgi:hypothetical protein